jgi:hypothetical protein
MGSIGQRDAGAFGIGARLDAWQPADAGELFCFANDVGLAYWNNSGTVRLTVRRTA